MSGSVGSGCFGDSHLSCPPQVRVMYRRCTKCGTAHFNDLHSTPPRVKSRTLLPSFRASNRQPSYLISCNHSSEFTTSDVSVQS
jgi:hypothetical protein